MGMKRGFQAFKNHSRSWPKKIKKSSEEEWGSLTPEGGKLRIVQRIAEFNLDLIGRADLSRVVLAPEGAGRTARDGREERAGEGERLVVKPMTGLDRLPEDLSAGLPSAVNEIAADPETIRISCTARDESRCLNDRPPNSRRGRPAGDESHAACKGRRPTRE